MLAKRKRIVIITLTVFCLGVAGAIVAGRLLPSKLASTPATITPTKEEPQPAAPKEAYSGIKTNVANVFSVKVPDGWRASTSDSTNFTAIMFAQPEQLGTLVYTPGTPPTVTSGIATWNGLTEHFFIRTPRSSSQTFNPSDHQEITSEPFTFSDGTVGTKYYVVKHTTEAAKWGGLLRDTEWQGRTYIYKKDGAQIEAHLALYPSHTIDIAFYESVIRTVILLAAYEQ